VAGDRTPRDLRLAIPVAGLWGGAWAAPALGATGAFVAGGALAVFGVVSWRRAPWWAAAALLLAALGATSMALRLAALHADPFEEWAQQQRQVAITGVLIADPTFERRSGSVTGSQTRVVVPLRAERVVSGASVLELRTPVLVLGDAEGWQRLGFGQSVQVSGSLRTADGRFAAVLFAASEPDEVAAPPLPLRVADSMRAGLREAVGGLPPEVRGLLPALVVGDTSQMPALLTADMKASGLTHLTAVSGANVAILVGTALLLTRLVGVRGYGLLVVGLVSVVWFVVLARPQPSVLRAALMGVLALVAVVSAGRTQAVRTLLAAVLLLLLVDPWLARSWGFALSVAATAGLVLCSRPIRDALPAALPDPVREATAVAVAAQLATLPLVLALSGQLAVLAAVANVAVTAAVPLATVLGALAAAVAPVWPEAAGWCAWLAQWPTRWITAVAQWTAARPAATVPWPDGWTGAVLGVAVVALLVALVRRGRGRSWWRPWRLVAMASAALVLVAAYWLGPGRWPPQGWVMAACDVGQGDALAVNLGAGSALVVDAGPDADLVDRCLDRLGVENVPLLVLTHFHADHVEGLPGVLRDRTVGQVLVSPWHVPVAQVDEVARWTTDLPVTTAEPGQSGAWGPARWSVLWPGRLPDTGTDEGSGPNNASVVLLVEVSGVRLLLTGDVEPEAQEALVQQGVPAADVLKVPHHGSKYQVQAFLSAVGARVALISVGADNGYGHPDPGLVDSLESAGMAVARTDQLGSVAVVSGGDGLRVVPMP
jgi:competence protein ComEC